MPHSHRCLSGAAAGPATLLLILCTCLISLPAFAQIEKRATPVSPHLRMLTQADAASKQAALPDTLDNPLLRVRDGYIAIDAVAADDAQALLSRLEGLGLRGGAVYGRMVSGKLPVGAIDALEGVKGLKSAAPAAALTRAGLVTSRGDVTMRSDLVRDEFEVDGRGVVVGTLSDSYDCLGGAAAGVASGDLPPGVVVQDDTACPASEEGRAMMEFIRDVAPGAGQAFHTAFNGQADFASGIVELATVAQADIVVDDIIYFAEPMFQDGIIAQAVDQVVDMGVAYFSSAGNSAREAYESDFRDSGIPGVFGPFTRRHDFDPGPGVDDLQTVTFGNGFTIFSFQWDEPFFSVSGPPGSASDMDLLFYDMDGNLLPFLPFNLPLVVFQGFSDNIFSGDPVEVAGVLNLGPAVQLQVGLELFAGPAPNVVKYVYFDGAPTTVDEFDTASGSVYGHSNAAGAEAVGATAWFNTPPFNPNVTRPIINSFSSAGPTPILFKPNGKRLKKPKIRKKPGIVGPDGGNTTFFGNDLSFSVPGTTEPDGFPNFFGTSAAAPHVAAAAALYIQARTDDDDGADKKGDEGDDDDDDDDDDRPPTPKEIYRAFQKTAVDMDDPLTPAFDKGFDFRTGFGFIDLFAALGGDDDDDDEDEDDADKQGLVASLDGAVPTTFALGRNYPNPFNPTTTLTFQVPEHAPVRLEVFDLLGRRVQTLVRSDFAPGRYEVAWNGRDDAGQPVPSGVYLYRMVTPGFADSGVMTLLK